MAELLPTAASPGTKCSVPAASNGEFKLTLPNGRYRITGRSPLYNNGRVDCAANYVITLPRVGGFPLVMVNCQRE